MKKQIILGILLAGFLFVGKAWALAAKEDAENIAVLKAVMNYKINDEEHAKDLETLRQDERFNRRLQRMLDKLSNKRTKDSTNQKVLKILEKAGKDLKRLLD